MTRAARLFVLAGLTAIAAMMAAEAPAQGCAEWLKWACPDSAASDAAARKSVRQERRLSRTKASSKSESGRKTKQAGGAAPDTVTQPKPQQKQAPDAARPAKAARHIPTGDRGERQQTRIDPALNEQEKEALFQQFLEWGKAPRRNVEINR